MASSTKQELRDAAQYLADSAPNPDLGRFYAAIVAEMDRQLAFDASRTAGAVSGDVPSAKPSK